MRRMESLLISETNFLRILGMISDMRKHVIDGLEKREDRDNDLDLTCHDIGFWLSRENLLFHVNHGIEKCTETHELFGLPCSG